MNRGDVIQLEWRHIEKEAKPCNEVLTKELLDRIYGADREKEMYQKLIGRSWDDDRDKKGEVSK